MFNRKQKLNVRPSFSDQEIRSSKGDLAIYLTDDGKWVGSYSAYMGFFFSDIQRDTHTEVVNDLASMLGSVHKRRLK